ncbi:MAG: ribbon-helix-helix protein, CopG family [Candidatus Woesearchaeota archaeon]
MVMETLQIRLSKGMLNGLDSLVKTGLYSSRSDVIRDAVRRLTISSLVGIIPNKGDSVKEVREIRKVLSKQPFDLNEINKLIK